MKPTNPIPRQGPLRASPPTRRKPPPRAPGSKSRREYAGGPAFEEIHANAQRIVAALYRAARVGQWYDHGRGEPPQGGCPAARALLALYRTLTLHYVSLARGGDRDLIGELPLYARQLVEAMDELAPTHAGLFAEQARHEISWPILAARHFPKESDFKQLADLIQLGSEAVVNTSPRARYRLSTPINRFLLDLLAGTIATAKEFYFVSWPENPPKLTAASLPVYLDDLIMPMLDEIRAEEGCWEGIPALASIVRRIPYESEHRSAIRNRIQRALRAMAAHER